MTLYRVSYYTDRGSSAGFSWHETRKAAEAAAAIGKEQEPDEGAPTIHPVEFVWDRDGVLYILNTYASHPDNG